jgi:hypothetical protein
LRFGIEKLYEIEFSERAKGPLYNIINSGINIGKMKSERRGEERRGVPECRWSRWSPQLKWVWVHPMSYDWALARRDQARLVVGREGSRQWSSSKRHDVFSSKENELKQRGVEH